MGEGRAAKRRARIVSLYLLGRAQAEIASELGCTKQNVSKHLKRTRLAWQQSTLEDFGAAKARELAKLDEVEREAWEGWAFSKRLFQSVKKKSGMGGEETVRRMERRDGNPRFLQTVLSCIAKRCEIKGLNSPQVIRLEDAQRLTDAVADLILAFVPEEEQEAALAMLNGSLPKQTIYWKTARVVDSQAG